MTTATAVAARGIHKSFGSTRALRGVDLALAPGRCLGLVGRNGAGKSTMVSILSGLQRPDAGEVTFDGEPAPPAGAVHAWREKIATVHQHSMIVPELTVAENVFLGRLPSRRGRVDWSSVRADARAVLGEWGTAVDAAGLCRDLSVEQRQIVELARAVAAGTRVLLLDEPTAALEHDAVQRLFARVRQLVDSGVAVLYISHHLEEVFDICDDVAVLRDGELVLSAPTIALRTDDLVNAMVHGTTTPTTTTVATPPVTVQNLVAPEVDSSASSSSSPTSAVLEVRNLSVASPNGDLSGVSLSVRPGESVGVIGLISSGVVTLGRTAAGTQKADEGDIVVGGRTLPPGDRAAALKAGVGYIPEDRRMAGFVGGLSIAENMTMSVTDQLSAGKFGILGPRAVIEAAKPWAESLALVSSSLKQHVDDLSGGNQQKVTVARALARGPRLLVAITPTRGVDVASKELLLQALRQAADAGAGVLLATDELDDLAYCDRVLVLVRGRIAAERPGGELDRAALIAAIEGVAA
ncbi:sugar ABC transporter ATP-binding protein [Actinospica sp.]|jgi:simple sugar transport system ATP-binding protein|uniref:sugar ABC transporter ATP-binding protein n=1 Tax=Actinospica sp. TaxID=1872142 RepID=UPI002B8545E9|nr:sugar ABC transporter ATP-binding protein [Actinospica sp.]HWG24032.1 sugar ABC transporter ATP-binding protein [Actinospica sp.]